MLIPDRPLARQSESNTEMKDEAGISVHRTMSLVDERFSLELRATRIDSGERSFLDRPIMQ